MKIKMRFFLVGFIASTIVFFVQTLWAQNTSSKLSINSLPSGADIFIESAERSKKNMGKTPLILELQPGLYKIAIERKGYYPVETVTEVSEKGKNRVNLKLIPIPKATIELHVTPAFAEVFVNGRAVVRNKIKELHFNYLSRDQKILVKGSPGSYEIEVFHEKAIDGPLKKQVVLTKPGEIQTHFFKLEMESEFIAELELKKQAEDIQLAYDRELKEYYETLEAYTEVADRELFSWRLKWIGAALGATVAAYYSYDQNQKATEELQAMEESELKMKSADSLREAQIYDAEATDHSKKVADYSNNSTQGTVTSVVLVGLTYWFWLNKPSISVGNSPPEPPIKPESLASSGLFPLINPHQLGLTYVQRW